MMDKIYFKQLEPTLKDWADQITKTSQFDNAYIFGSLIHRDGDLFVPGGAVASDIDIILKFKAEEGHCSGSLTAKVRYESMLELIETIPDLEVSISRIIAETNDQPRNTPYLSILPLTQFEIYHCIHKGYDPKIFTQNVFYDLNMSIQIDDGLEKFIDSRYHFDNIEVFTIARIVQKLRNHFLHIDFQKKRKLVPFASNEIFPKELMRSAALLKFLENVSKAPKNEKNDHGFALMRTDLLQGETFLLELLKNKSAENDNFSDLWDKVEKRRSARTEKPALGPEDVLLIAEILFDEAKTFAQPSIREIIDRAFPLDIKTNKLD